MTVLFLVIGLEVKRELTIARLGDPGWATLPILAALAGAAVPALVFLAFNPHSPAARGWAIPMATDPAFAVGSWPCSVRGAGRGQGLPAGVGRTRSRRTATLWAMQDPQGNEVCVP